MKTPETCREARVAYLKLPAVFAEKFMGKFGFEISDFEVTEKLKVFSEFCGSATSFSSYDMIRKIKNKVGSAGQSSNNFADCFLKKHGNEIADFPLIEILKVFYVYKECNGQFSVSEYIHKRKKAIG